MVQLTRMEERLSYETALGEAQALGYADVEGFDPQYKATILANIVMNTPMKREK